MLTTRALATAIEFLKKYVREYEVFVGSIFATALLAPVWAMRLALGRIPFHPVVSSLYTLGTVALSVVVQDPLSKSLLTPFPGVEADTYFKSYHVGTVDVREGQAPYDAVYEFGKSRTGAKFEVLRTPKFDAIFNGLCEFGDLDCSEHLLGKKCSPQNNPTWNRTPAALHEAAGRIKM